MCDNQTASSKAYTENEHTHRSTYRKKTQRKQKREIETGRKQDTGIQKDNGRRR